MGRSKLSSCDPSSKLKTFNATFYSLATICNGVWAGFFELVTKKTANAVSVVVDFRHRSFFGIDRLHCLAKNDDS